MSKVRYVVIAVALASLVAVMVVFGGKNVFEKEVDKERSAVKFAREVEAGGYGIITTDELKALVDGKAEMVLVDAMPYEKSYRKAHIPGAKQFLFPIPEMADWDAKETGDKTEKQFADLLGPDKGRLIVVYCGFTKCTRSHNGAVWARKLGYTNVKRHPGGIYAWKGMGFPTEGAGADGT